MSVTSDLCAVCEDPVTAFQRQERCAHCGWYLCAACLEKHLRPEPGHLNHPASTGKCRGRKDTP